MAHRSKHGFARKPPFDDQAIALAKARPKWQIQPRHLVIERISAESSSAAIRGMSA
jgi:hypothetical protein